MNRQERLKQQRKAHAYKSPPERSEEKWFLDITDENIKVVDLDDLGVDILSDLLEAFNIQIKEVSDSSEEGVFFIDGEGKESKLMDMESPCLEEVVESYIGAPCAIPHTTLEDVLDTVKVNDPFSFEEFREFLGNYHITTPPEPTFFRQP